MSVGQVSAEGNNSDGQNKCTAWMSLHLGTGLIGFFGRGLQKEIDSTYISVSLA